MNEIDMITVSNELDMQDYRLFREMMGALQLQSIGRSDVQIKTNAFAE